jgi:hypothetical protein
MLSMIALLVVASLQQPATAEKPAPRQPCSGQKLVGTWQLAEWSGTPVPSTGPTTLKHITPTHFFVVAVDDKGTASYGHGGPYEVSGNTYTETIVHGFGDPFGQLRGTKVSFECGLEGDVWHNVGEIGGQTFDERWKRVTAVAAK